MDIFTDKADLSGITGQPQHRISQVSYIAFCFMGPWLLILTSLSLQLFVMQNLCKEALLHMERQLLAYRVFTHVTCAVSAVELEPVTSL